MRPKRLPAHRVAARGKGGRPTAFTPDVVRALCAAYATGISLRDAATVAGISCSTAKAWAKESRENPNGPKGAFWPMIRGALAKSIVVAAAEARRVDPKWWLARMAPRRFGDARLRVKARVRPELGRPPAGQFENALRRIAGLKDSEEGVVSARTPA